jgi:hypothetical protein
MKLTKRMVYYKIAYAFVFALMFLGLFYIIYGMELLGIGMFLMGIVLDVFREEFVFSGGDE